MALSQSQLYTDRMQRLMLVVALSALLCVSAFGQEDQVLGASDLWSELLAGNRLFVEGQVVYGSLRSARGLWAGGQDPPVAVLSCADSRVPVELIFQRTVGELFVVRVAGNVEDAFNVASLEYSVSKRWTKLIVVMGHSQCGAIQAAIKGLAPHERTPWLVALINRIQYSFLTEKPDEYKATIDNVCFTAAQLRNWSDVLKDAQKVPIKTAYYDVKTGVVTEVTCGRTKQPPLNLCPPRN